MDTYDEGADSSCDAFIVTSYDVCVIRDSFELRLAAAGLNTCPR